MSHLSEVSTPKLPFSGQYANNMRNQEGQISSSRIPKLAENSESVKLPISRKRPEKFSPQKVSPEVLRQIRELRDNDPVIINAKRHKMEQQVQYNVKTQKKYESLNENPDLNMDSSDTVEISEQVRAPKKVKIPPIVITEKVNYPNVIQELNNLNIYTPKTQTTRNGLKIFLNNIKDFEKLKGFYKQNNRQFYTHALKHERPVHQVIKGLPLVEVNIIEKELRDKGSKCIKVSLMKQKNQDYNPIYLATFESGTDLAEVQKVNEIYYSKVKWEKFRNKSGVTQCHRCQEFGHGSNFCNKTARCVKCDKEHTTSECNKTDTEKPYCVNCGPESKVPPHRANSRTCPVYMNRLELIHKQRTKTPQVSNRFELNPRQFPALPTRNPWQQAPKAAPFMDFPNFTKNNEQMNQINSNIDDTKQTSEFFEVLKEINEIKKMCNLSKILTILKNLKEGLKTATTEAEQAIVFLQTVENANTP